MKNTVAAELQFQSVWPQCVARAWQDAQFREALKRDPAGTLYQAFQFTVPAGIDLQVAENEDAPQASRENTLRLVIPPLPDMDMQQVAVVGAQMGSTRMACDPERPPPFSFSAC